MKFLVISQRAIGNYKFSLKNLTGHGRIDVILRCILAATQPIQHDSGTTIYCYLKGRSPHGWIEWNKFGEKMFEEDEISIAAYLKQNWNELYQEGNLEDLLGVINPEQIILLSEDGIVIDEVALKSLQQNGLVVLGAQQDLLDVDLDQFKPDISIKLGNKSLLASHAIIYYRQNLVVLK